MHFILSSCGRAAFRKSPPRPHLLIFALTKLSLLLHTTLPIHTPYISPLPTDYVSGDLETQTFGIPYNNTWQATKVACEATAFNLSKQHFILCSLQWLIMLPISFWFVGLSSPCTKGAIYNPTIILFVKVQGTETRTFDIGRVLDYCRTYFSAFKT